MQGLHVSVIKRKLMMMVNAWLGYQADGAKGPSRDAETSVLLCIASLSYIVQFHKYGIVNRVDGLPGWWSKGRSS